VARKLPLKPAYVQSVLKGVATSTA